MSKKVFKTFNEQLEILEKRNLIVENEKERSRILWYLRKYNYQNFIFEYKTPFIENDKIT